LASVGRVRMRQDPLWVGGLGVDEDFAFHAAVAGAARNRFYTATLAMLDSHIRFGINLTHKLSLRQPVGRLLLVQKERGAGRDRGA
jgi:GntR family transcriptional regulator, transcriptional repressor for pyruvate dehydrogenase complex